MQQWDGHRPTLLCPCTWQSFDFSPFCYEQVTPTPTQAEQAGGQGITQEGPPSLHTPTSFQTCPVSPKQHTEPAKSCPGPCRTILSPSSPHASTIPVSLERGASGALAVPHAEPLPPRAPLHFQLLPPPFLPDPVPGTSSPLFRASGTRRYELFFPGAVARWSPGRARKGTLA